MVESAMVGLDGKGCQMDYLRARLVKALVGFFGEDDGRIEHALRVLYHCERIMEQRGDCDGEVVIACALLHDVGIKVSEEKLGYNDGRTQEQYGPGAAAELLAGIGLAAEKVEKVKEIIGNHHSASRYDYPELEVLKEGDRIVNRGEEKR